MSDAAGTLETREVGPGRLWYGIMIGPLAWKLQLMVNYALVPYACFHEMSILIHLASLLTVALALTGAAVALTSWGVVGRGLETENGGAEGRSRFMALAGLLSSGFFALIILGQWLPNLVLSPCDGIV